MRFTAPKATYAYFRKFHDPHFRLDCSARYGAKKMAFHFAPYALDSRMTPKFRHILAIVVLFMSAKLAYAASTELGIFSHQRDIGNVAKPGSVNFDPAKASISSPAAAETCGTPTTTSILSGENVGRFHADGGC